jgi:hypothetical protein
MKSGSLLVYPDTMQDNVKEGDADAKMVEEAGAVVVEDQTYHSGRTVSVNMHPVCTDAVFSESCRCFHFVCSVPLLSGLSV